MYYLQKCWEFSISLQTNKRLWMKIWESLKKIYLLIIWHTSRRSCQGSRIFGLPWEGIFTYWPACCCNVKPYLLISQLGLLKMKLFHKTFEVMGLTRIHPSIRPYKSVCHCSYATYFLLLGAREFGVLQTEVVVKSTKEIGCTPYKSITAIFSPQSAICPIYIF